MSETPEPSTELTLDLRAAQPDHLVLRDQHYIRWPWDRRLALPEALSKKPFQPIADDSRAQFSANGKPQAAP
jgi:hypothetical protein